jgi:hypothetical protein
LDRDGRANDHRDAKFTVLSESVRHRIKEEEGEMLPKAKSAEMDFEALGQQLLDRKRELKKKGIPSDGEHAMVAAAGGKGESPAAVSHRRKPGVGPVRSRSTPAKKAKSRNHPFHGVRDGLGRADAVQK